MSLEIRPIRPDELEEFNRVVKTAFASPDEFNVKMAPEWTLCAFVDGRIATTYAAWPLTMQLTGTSIPVAGVTMIGTLPVYRRRGYLRKITETHFKMLYERGEQAIAALFASMVAVYQRYGYAVVSTRNAYTIDPRHLVFPDDRTITGDLQEVGDSEHGLLLEIYYRFIAQRTGYLHRNEAMEVAPGAPFTVLFFRPVPNVVAKVVYREAGEPLGYVIYGVDNLKPGTPMGQRLMIRDLVWLTASAYRAIWNYFANMDLVREITWAPVPPDDPLRHLLLEPRQLNITSGEGLLARIVNVEQALPLRSYAAEGAFIFEVVDELCPWNQGRWKIETSAAGTDIRRTKEAPQLVMPISTLSMLLFGQISPSEAARMARLDALDDGSLPLWDRAMMTAHRPFCADGF